MPRSRGIYNEVYTPEKWEKVNSKNKEILNDFILEYKQRKKAKTTIEAYFQDLRMILTIIMERYENKCILELNKKDFRNISILLSDDFKLSSNRVNRMKSAMNSMLTFCEEDDEYDYDVNYAKKVAGLPKEKVKINEDDFFFTYEEFIKVREILIETGDLQTAVLWSMGFDSAARKNELYQVVKHGLLENNKTNIVRGKRGKMFSLVYLNDTKEIIRKYLEERGDDDIDSLWINKIGQEKEEITKGALYTRILKCSNILSKIRGEETNIFVHTMRHSRVESLLQGADDRLKNPDGTNRKYTLEEVCVLCHHGDVNTTQNYAKDHSEDTIDDMFGF